MAVVFEELERDWRGGLAVDRRAARRLSEVCARFGVASLLELEELVVRSGPAEADAVLVALVRRAVVGDGLAGRVLLQLLLPGARVLARRWWALGDSDERASAVVSAVWARIREYPIERRPARVAANVLMDASADLCRSLRRKDLVRPAGFAPGEEPVQAPSVHPAVELAEVLADAVDAGVVSPDDAQLIASSRIWGVSLRRLAESQGLKLRTLQHHRQLAEAALVAAAAA